MTNPPATGREPKLTEAERSEFVLVPREPTAQMHIAAWNACDNGLERGKDWEQFNARLWHAMLEFAPTPPNTVGSEELDVAINAAAKAMRWVKMPDGNNIAEWVTPLEKSECEEWGISWPSYAYDRHADVRDDQLDKFTKILARAALAALSALPVDHPEVVGDNKRAKEKLTLWFFRELTDEQRLALFSLFGMPVHEIGKVHGHQRRVLNRVLRSLQPSDSPALDAGVVEAKLAGVLHKKFGVQCGMSEIEMWMPIARAALSQARQK